jgi:GNAT superfamily N-acetyltransferase
MSFKFTHLERLGDHPRHFAYVLATFADEIEAGNYPAGRRVPNGDEHCWIVFDRMGNPVAFATHYAPDNTGLMWLDLLFVDWDVRRQGMGAELVALVSSKASEQGCNRVEWGTNVNNFAMIGVSIKAEAKQIGVTYRLPLQSPTDRSVQPGKAV